ncbi:MAG: hypothetical protein Q8930_14725 [Bacillota bacterium]|nr:hypothetical protein [Bacillota bacterium]
MWTKSYDYYMDYVRFYCDSDGRQRVIFFAYPSNGYGCLLYDSVYHGEDTFDNLEVETAYGLPEQGPVYVKHTHEWNPASEFENRIKDSDFNFQMPEYITDNIIYRKLFKNGILIKEERF